VWILACEQQVALLQCVMPIAIENLPNIGIISLCHYLWKWLLDLNP
jgi:hypothetical protein